MSPPDDRPRHVPVLTDELIAGLAVQPGGVYVDCTVGGGGHASAVLDASAPTGRLLGVDLDPQAVEESRARLPAHDSSLVLVNDSYVNLRAVCAAHGFANVDGVYFDLGLSTLQLESPSRGFSFQRDEPLDMRFSDRQEMTAADIVNTYSMSDLAHVLWTYGEERRSRAIARRIVAGRPLRTTGELARLVQRAVPGRGRVHPATRTFQALRICVNDELANLEQGLKQALEVLAPGGRLAAISYHSLEDRIVKRWLQREASDCICPPGPPVCVCGHTATVRLVNKRVIKPSAAEVGRNPRSRSAKLRIAQKTLAPINEEPGGAPWAKKPGR